MSEVVLACQGLTKRYRDGGSEITVLAGVDLTVRRSEAVAIVGVSGSGKSTLLHLLGGLDAPTSGEVLLLGERLHTLNEREKGRLRNRALGFVYQFHHLLPEFTALENVMVPLLIGRLPCSEARARAAAMLAAVGLAARLDHRPAQLSGGERQRVAIARALVTQPVCLLADEPTGNLDRAHAEQVFTLLLQAAAEQGAALVVVTHDEVLAARLHRRYRLAQGRLAEAEATNGARGDAFAVRMG